MNSPTNGSVCTLGELMIFQIAQTIGNDIIAFHGFGSPLVQLALHLAKRSHAPRLVLVAGATYGINPEPPFLTPTSNDLAMSHGAECYLDIEELFDLAANGKVGRMFLSGIEIDKWGNLNVTQLGNENKLSLKLPGGGGGCNLSCDVENITIWTAAHRAITDQKGRRRFRLVDQCNFITSVGHRTADGLPRSELPYRGKGPDSIVTELGVFDFNQHGCARLKATYPDTNTELIKNNTQFEVSVSDQLASATLPTPDMVEFIRRMDPLKIHQKELNPLDRDRTFEIA